MRLLCDGVGLNVSAALISAGTAERYCDKANGWQSPTLDKCVSNSFLVLRNKVRESYAKTRR